MSKWSDFYKDRIKWESGYQMYFNVRYRPFLEIVKEAVKRGGGALEIGAGIGSTSNELSATCIYASDNDPEMLALMRRNVVPSVTIIEHEATRPWYNRVGTVHSHGLLEHYDNETIRQIIAAHRTAKLQVHYVPGQYDEPSFGDERLMSVQSWQNICSPDQILVFNDGKDYALIFEGK